MFVLFEIGFLIFFVLGLHLERHGIASQHPVILNL